MIYLDNAATSWPKPEEVYQEVGDFLRRSGANPGRGGHRMAREASEMVEATRLKMAEYFHLADPKRFIFTCNATEALNLAIKGSLRTGDHVVTTSMEHNSVLRPLHYLKEEGVTTTIVQADPMGRITAGQILGALRPETKLIILTYASNVTGTVMPVQEVGRIARDNGILFLVDGAQAVGERDFDLTDLPLDMLAFPGHKALLGPTGIGGLYIREGVELELLPLKEGGTGTGSELAGQPQELPYRYESGTLNTSGIAGLGAALSFLIKEGQARITSHIDELTKRFIEGCREISGLQIYGPPSTEERVGVVSLNIEGLAPDELAFILDEVYEVAVRAGLHCAPLAHRTLGTYPTGAARFSFGYHNTPEEIDAAVGALAEIAIQAGG